MDIRAPSASRLNPHCMLLALAAREMDEARLDQLIAAGICPNGVDAMCRTPLLIVAEGPPGPAKLLLDRGAKADLADNRGRTPLMLAASAGHADTAKLLATLGGGRARDLAGHTALMMASRAGSLACCEILAPISWLSERSRDGHAAPDYARFFMRMDVIEFFEALRERDEMACAIQAPLSLARFPARL